MKKEKKQWKNSVIRDKIKWNEEEFENKGRRNKIIKMKFDLKQWIQRKQSDQRINKRNLKTLN